MAGVICEKGGIPALILAAIFAGLYVVGPKYVDLDIENRRALTQNLDKQTENIAIQTVAIHELADVVGDIAGGEPEKKQFRENASKDHAEISETVNTISNRMQKSN